MRRCPGIAVSVGLLAACHVHAHPDDSEPDEQSSASMDAGSSAPPDAASSMPPDASTSTPSDASSSMPSDAARAIKYGNDDLITGWHDDQPRLDPATVGGSSFGQLFKVQVTGQVFAEPLVYRGIVFIVTEENFVYGLDAETGDQMWAPFNVGAPFQAADIGCSDLAPSVGITGTPVIDDAGIAYFLAKSYVTGTSGAVRWQMHGVDVTTGAEQVGFPVTISGAAANDPVTTFAPRTQLQRPGLLLQDGVVYAGFGSQCDIPPYQGWLVGVTTAGRLQTMWTTEAGEDRVSGAAIWQSGAGLMSDGPGRIFFATGNGGGVIGPMGGNTPPGTLGESVVRVEVQPDGSLRAVDFFSPFNAKFGLDPADVDFGSGGPVGLPPEYFGTVAHPNLLVVVGKEGFVYLLDNDNLGGIGNGPGGSDNVVARIGPNGGVWSNAAVWPGDGGYIYLVTAEGPLFAYKYGLDGAGTPTLSVAGTSSDDFGFSSGAPVVTSNSTLGGTSLVWIVWSSGTTGVGGQLRAYDTLPGPDGKLVERFRAPIGTATKFAPVGIGDNRVYVATRDGTVFGFGAPAVAFLDVPPSDFGAVVLGDVATRTVTISAQQASTITSISTSSLDFTVGTLDRALPATLEPGDTMSVPVRFSPRSLGGVGGSLDIQTSVGAVFAALSGRGLSAEPLLAGDKSIVSFGGVAAGGTLTAAATFSNEGVLPLTITDVSFPDAPFSVSGLPLPGTVLGSGEEITVSVSFSPTAIGDFGGAIVLESTGGNVSVPLSGSSQAPGRLVVSTLQLDAGEVASSATRTLAFTVSNVGDSIVTITKSKPPVRGSFIAQTALDEGSKLAPGDTRTVVVTFAPAAVGLAEDAWVINGDDASGIKTVVFTGTGVAGTPALSGGRFVANGSATITGNTAVLTSVDHFQTGTVFWPDALASDGLTISFDLAIGPGSGADGMTLVLADPAGGAAATSVGSGGGGLGATGIPGVVLAFDTFQNDLDPSSNFVGLAPIGDADAIDWTVTNAAIPDLRAAPRHVTVEVRGATLTVFLDGLQVLQSAMPVASQVLVGFTASTGNSADIHAVWNLSITGAP